jgi:guanine deaminase
MMSKKCILGSIVHSVQLGTLEIIKKGALVYNEKGFIESVLDLNLPASQPILAEIDPSQIIDHTDKLILPGFVDAHCHAPQYYFTGTGVDMDLMQWLETYTFPVEARFKDLDFARMVYEKSVKRHLKSGTTFASYYATIHKPAALVLADILAQVGQRAFVGKVAMDRNSPDILVESTADSVAETEDFARVLLGRTSVGQEFLKQVDAEVASGGYDDSTSFATRPTLLNNPDAPLVLPCVTPRFVPTCTSESMQGLGKVSHKYGLPVQSHLSESLNEIAFVKSLHPEASTYAGVYEVNGLLHQGAIMVGVS